MNTSKIETRGFRGLILKIVFYSVFCYMKEKEKQLSYGVTFGVIFGTIVGILTDNIALWLSIGIAIGAGVGTSLSQMPEKDKGDKSE